MGSMKNVPSSTQSWKTPVRIWIRDLYKQLQQRSVSKAHTGSAMPQELATKACEVIRETGGVKQQT